MTCSLCGTRTAQPPHGMCVMCRAITADQESPRALDLDVRGGRAVEA